MGPSTAPQISGWAFRTPTCDRTYSQDAAETRICTLAFGGWQS